MTLDELKTLRRGDVVKFFCRGRDPAQIEAESTGLVVRGSEHSGVEVLWDDGERVGMYISSDDADKLVLLSKVPKDEYKLSPQFQKMLAAERKKSSSR